MKKGEFLGFDVLDVSSICIETICRPGTIAKPNILLSPNWGLSTESSDKYSSQVPKMTLASLSVHRKMPMRTRPSVNLIFMFLFSKLRNNFRPGKSNGKTFLSYILRALPLLFSFTFNSDCNFPFFPERLSRDNFLSFPGKPVPSRCPVKIFEKGQTTDTYGQN